MVTLCDIQMDLCSIMAHTERTYDILLKWATYYVVSEYQKGNNEPFDEIFPNNREKIEQDMQTLIKNKYNNKQNTTTQNIYNYSRHINLKYN